MPKTFLLSLIVLLFSLPAFTQTSVAEAAARARSADQALPADAPTRDQVLTLLELTQARKNMVVAMENIKRAMKQGAEQAFRDKVSNPTPQQLAALQGIFDDIDVPLDEMINAIVPIYQRHFTKTDLDELTRFYSSPIGQKILREQPQVIQESMQAGAAIQQKRMNEIMTKIQQRVQQLVETNESSTSPKQ